MEDRAKTLQLVVAEEDVNVGVYEADQKIPRELLQHAGKNRVGVASYDAGRIAHRHEDRLVKPGHGADLLRDAGGKPAAYGRIRDIERLDIYPDSF